VKLPPLFFCSLWAVLTPLSALAQASVSAPAPAQLRTSITAIPYSLTIQAPEGAASISGGELTLSAAKGTDLYANVDGSKIVDDTPRVLFAPHGDFIFSARIQAGFHSAFDGAALLVYAGKAAWGKLLFERMPDGSNAVTTTITRGTGDDALHQQVEGNVVHLKIARKGGVYVFYLSADGAAWRVLRTFALPADQPVQVGFSAQSPKGERFTAHFADLRWRPRGFDNYWQGE
jgi:regulation of enolase protein 1 (concanavalin A-like superfamily)